MASFVLTMVPGALPMSLLIASDSLVAFTTLLASASSVNGAPFIGRWTNM